MEETIEKTENAEPNMALGKTIFFTFLKTVTFLVSFAFFVIAVLTSISPKTAIKIFDYLGEEKTVSLCYERIYNKSKDNSDLYNLIQSQIKSKQYKKAVKSIETLKNSQDYQAFCDSVDKLAIASSEKKYVAYVGNLDSYLSSQYVVCLYQSGNKDKAKAEAISDLFDNDNLFSLSIASYVDCLIGDKSISDSDLSEKLSALLSEQVEGKGSVSDGLADRDMALKNLSLAGEVNPEVKDILRVYARTKIYATLYNIYELTGQEEDSELAKQQLDSLDARYDELINS